jgi:hypothetical protein
MIPDFRVTHGRRVWHPSHQVSDPASDGNVAWSVSVIAELLPSLPGVSATGRAPCGIVQNTFRAQVPLSALRADLGTKGSISRK